MNDLLCLGLRDYIHIMDLADGHVAALQHLNAGGANGFNVFNLGTGYGYTVLEMIEVMSRVVGNPIPFQVMKI
jgi:UDP-glucose 4-epimerase